VTVTVTENLTCRVTKLPQKPHRDWLYNYSLGQTIRAVCTVCVCVCVFCSISVSPHLVLYLYLSFFFFSLSLSLSASLSLLPLSAVSLHSNMASNAHDYNVLELRGMNDSQLPLNPAQYDEDFDQDDPSFYVAHAKSPTAQRERRATVTMTQPLNNQESPLVEWVDSPALIYPLMAITVIAIVILSLRQADAISFTAFLTSQILLQVLFVSEIILRMAVMSPAQYFRDKQCVVDVCVSSLDLVLLIINEWSTTTFVLRLIRIVTLLKGFRTFFHRHHTELAEAVVTNKDGSIVRYNPNKLFSWGFITNLHGSVLKAPDIYVQFFVLAIFTTLYGFNLCADDCGHAFVSALPSKVGTATCSKWCFASIGPSNGLVFGSLVAFLLGLFNSATFNRWWAMRDRLGVVIGRANDISLMYSAYVTGHDKHSDWARMELIRYTNLAHASVYKQACEDDDYSDLIKVGMCTEREWEILKPLKSRYMMIYSWLVELFLRTAESGRVAYPQTIVPLIHGNITKQRGAAADVL
jgi:Bestrophin, RFP-TM, chloride channel